jgi:nucleotide-binding universal stress UspA family protein
MKSLLVHIDGSDRCGVRLQLARGLALQHQAHLLALFAMMPPMLQTAYPVQAEEIPLELLDRLHRTVRDKSVKIYESSSCIAPAVWAETGLWDDPVAALTDQAAYADLVVLGQHDPDASGEVVPADFATQVLVESGRPGIVVPYAGHFPSVGERVLVAWKRSPQAARALSASLPLLRRAAQVTVIEWDAEPPSCRGAALDIELYLRLQGVTAEIERGPGGEEDVGERLLSKATEVGADLLVMGCYGHSRAREFLMGGATRTVMRSMTIPVLFCH